MAERGFRKQSTTAVSDSGLRAALDHFTGAFVRMRESAQDELPNWEEMRRCAHRIKAHTMTRLDDYLLQLESKLEAAGGQVLWARTAEEASAVIVDIAGRHGCKRAVKSKSMTSEEVHLNEALQRAGVTPVETDLGEYVAQLAQERPSHILAPIIHKTRQDVGRLLAEKLKIPYTEEVEEMTRIARSTLRRDFFSADLGISGANFAVAETGTLVIVENEGNARLSTSLPRVHVVLMGIEKLLPRFADLGLFLPLLTRAATGQKMSSYVSLITGPRQQDDGPDHLYVVLLDNGRSQMLADPLMRQALYCIRCSACINICPVYKRTGGHSYDSVYPGPIGSVISPFLMGRDSHSELPFASTLCGACAEVCPMRIPLPEQLLSLRRQAADRGRSNPHLGRALRMWSFLQRHPRLRGLVLAMARTVQRLPGSSALFSRLPLLGEWSSFRSLPSLSRPGAKR
ncbi:MAG TPA: LutB/LldF family L-lactate oxidation iron-sulfur protein [Acidobacteriota bacterium]|nr:LutB/LldF family L-lactate oxidation iron-sulfur protein [Acidobacteriota bacterium]